MYKRKPSIRVSQKDIDEIDYHVRSFNSKLSWFKRKNGDLDYLPEYMSRAKVMEHVETRADLNFTLNNLKIMGNGFDGIKTDGGKIVSKGEMKVVKRLEWRENIRKGHMRRKLDEMMKEGKRIPMDEYRKYEPKNIDYNKLSPKEFDKYYETQLRMGMDSYPRYRAKIYKENIIKALKKNFIEEEWELTDGTIVQEVGSDLQELIDFIINMDSMELYEKVITDERKSIPQYYKEKYGDKDDAIEYFKEVWDYKE